MRAELLGSRWTQYLTVGGAMVGVRFDNVATGAVALRYFHLDHLGSVAVVTYAGGDVAERNSYDPWGKRRYSDGSDDPSGSLDSVASRGFTGQEHLTEVGLIHFNARLYDPLVGRFTSADSIVPHPGDPQSYNRYAYVRNRPLSATDPSGHADGGALPIIHIGANYWSTFNWASFVASGAGNQAYLAAVYGRIIGAAHYGASILPFAIGNQLQYRQYLSFLRIYGPQLQAAGFFMTRQPNLTPPPEPAPASTVAAGFAMGSNAYNLSVGYWAATRLGQFLDFCGVFCDAGAIMSVSSGLGPYAAVPGRVAGAGAAGLRSLANLSAAERAAAVAAESTVTLETNAIRFSQSNVRGSLPEITASMKANGWQGAPIDVVRMPDGALTAVDNTRLAAAALSNTSVQAVIRGFGEAFPAARAGGNLQGGT